MKQNFFFLLKSLLLLPATFAHEVMHLILALLTLSKITHFSLIPRVVREPNRIRYEFGSVGFIPKIRVLNFIVGLAPVILWGVWIWIMSQIGVLHLSESNAVLIPSAFLLHPWAVPVSIWLLWGGMPSTVDIRTSIEGFVSPSGLVLFVVIVLAVYFFGNPLPHGTFAELFESSYAEEI